MGQDLSQTAEPDDIAYRANAPLEYDAIFSAYNEGFVPPKREQKPISAMKLVPRMLNLFGPPEEDTDSLFDTTDGGSGGTKHKDGLAHRVHNRVSDHLVTQLTELAVDCSLGPCSPVSIFTDADEALRVYPNTPMYSLLHEQLKAGVQPTIELHACLDAEYRRLLKARRKYSDALVPIIEQEAKMKIPAEAQRMCVVPHTVCRAK